jgi:hypothetical protein
MDAEKLDIKVVPVERAEVITVVEFVSGRMDSWASPSTTSLGTL